MALVKKLFFSLLFVQFWKLLYLASYNCGLLHTTTMYSQHVYLLKGIKHKTHLLSGWNEGRSKSNFRLFIRINMLWPTKGYISRNVVATDLVVFNTLSQLTTVNNTGFINIFILCHKHNII